MARSTSSRPAGPGPGRWPAGRPVAGGPPAPPPDPARALPEPAGRGDRQHDPEHRAAHAGPDAARGHQRAAVDRRRVHAVLRGAADPGGRARRPVRPEALPARRPGRVRAGQHAGRVRRRHRHADRGARGDGPGRGVRHARHAVHPELGVPAPGAAAGHRGLVGGGRGGHRDRPDPGRPAAVPLLVGQRVPDQRPAGRGGAGRRAADRPGDRRAVRPPARHPGHAAGGGRAVPAGGRHHRGAQPRLDRAGHAARGGRRAGRAGRLRLVGAAHPASADRPAGVPLARVLGRGRVGDRDLLRPVRQPVRADPVPAAGARLQPAVRRGARAAVRAGHGGRVAGLADAGPAAGRPGHHPGRHRA